MRRHGFGIMTLVAAVLLLHGGAVVGQDKAKTKKHKDKSSDGVGAVSGACIGSAAGAALGAASVGMSTCSGQTSSCSPGMAGCCAGVDRGASAMKADQKLADELVKILNETQSSETFFVTLQCLMHTKASPDIAVPVIIRNADRLRLMKGFFDHSDNRMGWLFHDITPQPPPPSSPRRSGWWRSAWSAARCAPPVSREPSRRSSPPGAPPPEP